MEALSHPSFYAHVIHSFVILYAFYLLAAHWSQFQRLAFLPKMILVLLFSLVIGVHSLSHLGLEKAYHFLSLCSV
jgi:hypothetical protein